MFGRFQRNETKCVHWERKYHEDTILLWLEEMACIESETLKMEKGSASGIAHTYDHPEMGISERVLNNVVCVIQLSFPAAAAPRHSLLGWR